ncbi:MAG: TolC family protein [Bdellovibrionota bacterium]
MPSSRLEWHFNSFALAGLCWSLPVLSAQLSPQIIFENFSRRSIRLQNIQLQARAGEAQLGATEGLYDPELAVRLGNEVSRAESVSGLGNLEDRNLTAATSIKKRFSTGSQLEIQYAYLRQQSTLNPFTSTIRSPTLYENGFTLLARQSLLYNGFGAADRRRIDSAKKNDQALKLASVENSEELLLQNLRQFWTTYRSKEALNLALEARRIYDGLLKDVREKRRLGLVDAADLSRTNANFEAQEQKVKRASSAYLDNLARLYDLMDEKLPPETEEIVFAIPADIPEPPTDALATTEELRRTKIARAQVDAVEADRAAYKMENLPVLDLVGEAAWNGVDRMANRSFSDALSTTHPRYYVGVEFGFRFGNNANSSKLGDLMNRYELAKNSLELSRRDLDISGSSALRGLSGAYRIALSAQSARESFRQLLQQEQRSYRVGRIDLSQLILDYTQLFDSELMALDAFSNYHQLLHEWAALNDKLFKEPTL